MHPTHTEYLAHLAQLERGLREIVAFYKAALVQVEDQGSRSADDVRELISLNEGALAQLQESRLALDGLSYRERDIVDGVGPPPSEAELWGHKLE